MNLRKLFALLMTAVMLLGMIPVGHAELSDCNHDWDSGKWLSGEPKNCKDWKQKTYTCTICGATRVWDEVGPCQPGSKTWIRPKGSNCQEYGVWEITCKHCGEWLEGGEEPGPHKWVTRTIEEPACEYPGLKQTVCSYCGDEKDATEEIPALGHDWSSWEWDGHPSCTEIGWQHRTCKRCRMREEREVAAGKHRFGDWVISQESTCVERGYRYKQCTVCGHKEWERIKVIDHVFGEWYVMNPPAVGVPGLEQRDCTYGCGTNEQREIPALEQEFIPAPPSISKVVINTPANGEYFVAGESIVYRITLTNNTGMALKGVALYDPLYSTPAISPDGEGSLAIARHLAVGESISGEFSYDVTAEFALSGKVVNTAEAVYVYADDPQAMLYRAYSNTLETPVGIGDLPELHCSFGQSNVPANNEYYVPGETVRFEVEYSNPSLYPLVMGYVLAHVKDVPGVDVSGLATMTVLDAADVPAGESAFAYIGYTVTEEDAARGAIYGYAAFTANLPNGTPVKAAITDFVTVPCGVEENGSDKLSDASLTLTMEPKYEYGPDNGTHYVLGECPWTNWKLHNNSESVTMTLDKVRYYLDGNLYMYWKNEINNRVLAPGADFTDHTSWYYITEEDIARGYVTVIIETDCIGDDGKMYYATAKLELPCGPGELPVDPSLTMGDPYGPANGTHYVLGEVVRPAWTVKNNSEDRVVTLLGTTYNWNDEAPFSWSSTETLNPGRRVTRRGVTRWVTQEDVTRGYVTINVVEVCGDGENEYTLYSSLQVPCGPGELPDDYVPPVDPDIDGDGIPNEEDPDPNGTGADGVTVTKSIRNTPANGSFFVPGEVIEFVVSVQNNSEKTLDVVVLTDPLSGDFFHELLDIPGGAMDSRSLNYTVNEIDAEIGFVINYAYAVVYVDGDPRSMTSNSVTAPCGFPEGENPFGVLTGLEITKEEESLPLNGSYYTEGETVAYKITYTNIGEMPLTDVMIYDAMSGMSEIATAETLNPGESRMCWFNYTVTAVDVTRGYISNTAIGQFDVNGCISTVSSNTVTVDTNGKQEIGTVYPFWPGDDSEYDPGTGWQPDVDPAPEGKNPPFGTIDTDALHSGKTYCVRTITGRDNASVSYETSFCAEHADTQASVLMMHQAGATPEMQMQAAAYAVALWRSEVEKLYQELMAAADPAAQAVLMTEYIHFVTDTANYEAVLKLLNPDQPALTAMKVAEIWENKCIDLCYDAHATVTERKDSLLSVKPTVGAATASCTCEVTAQESGKKTSVQRYCAMHSFPFGMIDMLLQGNDTAQAWTTVRQIWGVELTNAYNKIYTAMGENKLLAMAEYNAMTQWMMAREASLIALYPANPEVVAQTMVKLIMNRVNDLCQAIK